MNPVYITRASKYLPNAPIGNEQMEDFLGKEINNFCNFTPNNRKL